MELRGPEPSREPMAPGVSASDQVAARCKPEPSKVLPSSWGKTDKLVNFYFAGSNTQAPEASAHDHWILVLSVADTGGVSDQT